jgi:hypothetical protein
MTQFEEEEFSRSAGEVDEEPTDDGWDEVEPDDETEPEPEEDEAA